MKFIIRLTILSCFLIATSVASFAQSETTKKNILKVNILSPILKTGSFFYERALNDNASLMLGVFYTNASANDIQFSGFGITPAYRFYLSNSKKSPVGFYLSPYGRFMNFTVSNKNTSDEGTLTTYGAGLELGYQWVFKDVVALNLFGGLGYSGGSVSAKGSSNVNNINSTGIGLDTSRLIGLSLGFAF